MKKKEKFVDIKVEIDDVTFFKLSLMAHREDITINELCRRILREHLKEVTK